MATPYWRNRFSPRLNPFLNPSQVDQMGIQSREKVSMSELDLEKQKFEFAQQRYNQILEMYKGAFGGKGGGFNVPSEFGENIALFQPGGQFGEGAKAEIHRGGQQAIAAGQIGLASTGMSSGTNVAGLHARVSADTALARKKIEDERVMHLGSAYTTAGQADLTAQQLRAQREAELMRTLGSLG